MLRGLSAIVVLMPLLNEAMFAVMEGVATPQAVDDVFRLGMAHPMGPLALADFIGLDVCLDILRVLGGGEWAIRSTGRVRCWCAWSMPVGWAARAAKVFTSTKKQEAASSR